MTRRDVGEVMLMLPGIAFMLAALYQFWKLRMVCLFLLAVLLYLAAAFALLSPPLGAPSGTGSPP